MEQNVLPFVQDNIFSNIKVDELNAAEKRYVVDMAKTILKTEYKPGKLFSEPDETKTYLQFMYQDYEHEVFAMMLLTQRHRLITIEEVSRGTLSGASVYPREIVKTVLKHNSAAVLLIHNHPSGDPSPSEADKRITGRLVDALKLIDVRVLDHMVVGKEGVFSFAQNGLI